MDDAEDRFELAKNKLGYTHSNDSWPMYSFFESPLKDWGNSFDPWKMMIKKNSSSTSEMANVIIKIIDDLLTEMKTIEGL